MIEVTKKMRVLPVHIINPRMDKEQALLIGEEFESLIATLGATIIDRLMQKIDHPDKTTYIGSGKVSEIAEIVKEKQIDIVTINAVAKPGQIHAVKEILQIENAQIEVWDRVDLILHIFDKHATTTEAKLQIELARMRYMGPRIYGMGHILSRQGGGIGTSGIGETNTELMRRHWRDQMKKITDQLAKTNSNREQQIERRRRAGFQTVSIVGYTNAGKSSLFNVLSGKNILVENALFATLDSSVGKMYIPALKKEVLITDTIGFIRNLPLRFIEAFKSTLIESMQADVLLHVIDVSDPEIDKKIEVVTKVLEGLGRNTRNVIYVFNKIDKMPHLDTVKLQETYKSNTSLFVSAKTGKGIAEIHDKLVSFFTQNEAMEARPIA